MEINLNNKFYKKEAIAETIEAFKEICECRIINNSFEVELLPIISGDLDLEGEFCNFVLGLTKDNNLF